MSPRRNSHGLIILNTALPPKDRYQHLLQKATVVLCADGGADRALQENIAPDFVIGDLDSISPEAHSRLKSDQLISRPSQYATDLEKTLKFALECNIREVTVIGASGGRLDHQICNLNSLEKFSDRLGVTVVDEYGMGRYIFDRWRFSGEIGEIVSIFAFGQAEGITTAGLKFPLTNATMAWAKNDGLSNEIVSSPVEISVQTGTLFVYRVGVSV